MQATLHSVTKHDTPRQTAGGRPSLLRECSQLAVSDTRQALLEEGLQLIDDQYECELRALNEKKAKAVERLHRELDKQDHLAQAGSGDSGLDMSGPDVVAKLEQMLTMDFTAICASKHGQSAALALKHLEAMTSSAMALVQRTKFSDPDCQISACRLLDKLKARVRDATSQHDRKLAQPRQSDRAIVSGGSDSPKLLSPVKRQAERSRDRFIPCAPVKRRAFPLPSFQS